MQAMLISCMLYTRWLCYVNLTYIKGYEERKFSSNPKWAHDHVNTGSRPIITYDKFMMKENTKVIWRKGTSAKHRWNRYEKYPLASG